LISAVMLTSGRRPRYETETLWADIMDNLSEAAYRRYRRLVEKPEFLRYFHETTPIDHIALLNIGSRPTRRKATLDITDLRAIPWVFAWTQSRVNLPSWYGVGTALEQWVEVGDGQTGTDAEWRLAQLRSMYENWPFFHTVLDNVQMGLCKGDMAIASLYAELTDAATREVIFADLKDEYARTERMALAVTGYRELLENESWLQRSIKLRNPYVDPMNYLQVAILDRLRQQPDVVNAADLRTAVLLSVNGVAAGLQNTG
jgi:phosphoenolpyruvate carboxylase